MENNKQYFETQDTEVLLITCIFANEKIQDYKSVSRKNKCQKQINTIIEVLGERFPIHFRSWLESGGDISAIAEHFPTGTREFRLVN